MVLTLEMIEARCLERLLARLLVDPGPLKGFVDADRRVLEDVLHRVRRPEPRAVGAVGAVVSAVAESVEGGVVLARISLPHDGTGAPV